MERLAGLTLAELRRRCHDELFTIWLPFWEKYGIDHENGGFLCALDYDGTLAHTNKFHWFQGRGVWVYSFLCNHFGTDARRLEVARKTKDFMLRHFPQPDGWWAAWVTREGEAFEPFQGDVYGMYFAAEGLQEYAWASGDDQARQAASDLMKRLWRTIQKPDFHLAGMHAPGQRPQGLWMVNLRTATQMLRRWPDPEIAAIADQAIDAVMHRHYNPDIGLNNEVLNFDFTRPKEEAAKSLIGHSVETLWMVMDEADRRGDTKLWHAAAERIRRHLEVGWDDVFGGIVEWVNVGHGCYQWPVERPVGTNLEFRDVGEYFYLKPMWALNECLIACLNVYERTAAEWAARFFGMAQELIDAKYSQKKRGLSGYMLFADRRLTPQPHVQRQDNYHPPRQWMLNILTLDRMLGA